MSRKPGARFNVRIQPPRQGAVTPQVLSLRPGDSACPVLKARPYRA